MTPEILVVWEKRFFCKKLCNRSEHYKLSFSPSTSIIILVSGFLVFHSSLKPHHITSKKPSSVLLMDIQSWSTLWALWNKHLSISPMCPLTQKCILRRMETQGDKEHPRTVHLHIRWAGLFHLGLRSIPHPLSHHSFDFCGCVKYWLLCSKFCSWKLSDMMHNFFHLLG